jgi:hypothetical protein
MERREGDTMAHAKRVDQKVRHAMWAVTMFEDLADRRDRDPEKLRRLAQLVARKAGALAQALGRE